MRCKAYWLICTCSFPLSLSRHYFRVRSGSKLSLTYNYDYEAYRLCYPHHRVKISMSNSTRTFLSSVQGLRTRNSYTGMYITIYHYKRSVRFSVCAHCLPKSYSSTLAMYDKSNVTLTRGPEGAQRNENIPKGSLGLRIVL